MFRSWKQGEWRAPLPASLFHSPQFPVRAAVTPRNHTSCGVWRSRVTPAVITDSVQKNAVTWVIFPADDSRRADPDFEMIWTRVKQRRGSDIPGAPRLWASAQKNHLFPNATIECGISLSEPILDRQDHDCGVGTLLTEVLLLSHSWKEHPGNLLFRRTITRQERNIITFSWASSLDIKSHIKRASISIIKRACAESCTGSQRSTCALWNMTPDGWFVSERNISPDVQ